MTGYVLYGTGCAAEAMRRRGYVGRMHGKDGMHMKKLTCCQPAKQKRHGHDDSAFLLCQCLLVKAVRCAAAHRPVRSGPLRL